MNIEAMKQALEALIEARRYVVGAYECAFPDRDLNESVIRQIDEAVIAIQQDEAQHTTTHDASGYAAFKAKADGLFGWVVGLGGYDNAVHVLWDFAHQQTATAAACGIPGMVKTTCPYCEQGFAFEFKQTEAKTGEPEEMRVVELANLLLATWKKVDPESNVAKYPTSYIHNFADMAKAVIALYTHPAPGVPDGYVLVRHPITEGMHAAACKVLIRSHGLSGVPQRMLTAMLAATQAQKGQG